MRKIRTLFLSAQPSVLAALVGFFTSDPLILPDFDDYDNYDKHRKKYEVVVFDDGSLRSNELEMIRQTLSAKDKYKKILYTYSTDKAYLNFFESSGIDGIVSKRADIRILEEAIINAKEGEKYFCSHIKNFLSGSNKPEAKIKTLSKREMEILQFVKDGLKNKQIASSLNLSIKTIEAHKENIKDKLNLKSVKDLRA